MLRVVLQGETGDVAVEDYIDALRASLEVLYDADRSVTGRQRRLDWKLVKLQSSQPTALLESAPRRNLKTPPQGHARLVTDRALEAISAIEHGRGVMHLSESTLKHLHALSERFARVGEPGVLGLSMAVVSDEESREAQLTRQGHRNLDALLSPANVAVGSVTGILVTVSVDRGRRFATVRDEVFGRAVQCDLPEELIHAASDALERRVTIRGRVYTDERSQPQRVDGRELEVLPSDEELPGAAETAGALPDFTGDLDTVEWLRQRRRRG